MTSTQWQLAKDAAERYETILVPAILGPAARALVAWAEPRAGERVIDVGCGTGAATRFAAARVGAGGHVVGVDLNGAMIEVARSLPPVGGARIEWVEGGADELPLEDRSFDLALCAQTLQFLSDRARALAEMYRVLVPGGRLALSLWCPLEQSPYFDHLVRAVSRHIDPDVAAGLGSAFALTDGGDTRRLLTEAGFSHLLTRSESLYLDLPGVPDFVPRHVRATPMAAGFSAASEAERRAVIEEMSGALAVYETPRGIRVPFCTRLFLGTREG